MQLLEGKSVAEEYLRRLRPRLAVPGRPPCLAFLRVGDNPASLLYVNRKKSLAESLGMRALERQLPLDAPEGEIFSQLARWNGDPAVDGILVQAPLPGAELQERAFAAVDPLKDVDGFHPRNQGLLALDRPGGFVPCTALAILHLLRAHGIGLAGQHAVIIGRSTIVGRPLALLLQGRRVNATVTVCHRQSRDLAALCRSADVLIAAAGSAHLVGPDWVRDGAVVVDVGQNVLSLPGGGRRLVGDVDFAAIAPRCRAITPVPGGVGPMTVAMLMGNVLRAWELARGMAVDSIPQSY
ncbi:MAG: bifunctional 5,10-methylenetetrahydrofolate dehydrogenase/5,10-methenyltetrahydrofolate cyclohydrolase [Puniceicoccales bacterium]|jgi:methylenetetrahydrofolate dehydrogenase (NADP+)/methenyltetrahydrofolate cyclohydrolase|nr:bifunctional 5,10-methylenetetrahydrofolate dehydrogenase/5,10-methenyltetrahydrofolate cyclohydrolase [Puniceicoccales bacterium]